jgi:type I restriction enzyme R subunit
MEIYSDTESGLDGFDTADLVDSIFTANEQKEALQRAHIDLLDIFGQNKFDRNNPRAWQAFFENDDLEIGKALRKEFYEKLSAFSRLLELAVGSYSIYESVGYEQMSKYKLDLLFFQKLRASLMLIYAEKVDFSRYEDGIRSLLNTFVTSEPVEIIVEPVAIHDRVAMDQQLDEIDGQKAKAAYIHTRLVSELEARRYEDPLLFKRFSERIRDTLDEYRRLRDDNSYLASMRKMADDLREGFVGHSYPYCISNDNDAKAFYGIISETLKESCNEENEEYDESIGMLASEMNNAIRSLARVDWRTSTAIHKKMNQAIDDLIWDFSEDHNLNLAIDQIDLLIENSMKTAMSRY